MTIKENQENLPPNEEYMEQHKAKRMALKLPRFSYMISDCRCDSPKCRFAFRKLDLNAKSIFVKDQQICKNSISLNIGRVTVNSRIGRFTPNRTRTQG